jgi:hypothetical protein
MNEKQILIQQTFKEGKFSHNKLRSKSNDALRYLYKEKTQFLPDDSSDSQRAWHIYNELYEYPLCSGGNERRSFTTFDGGYIKTCHLPRCQCSCWDTMRESASQRLKQTNESGKIKQSIQNKYGVDHVSHTPEVRQKISQIKKQQSDDWVRKIQSTMLEKYGAKTTLESQVLTEKVKETMFSRYGGSTVLGSPCLKLKVVQTINERYGVNNWQQRHLKDIIYKLKSQEHWDGFKSKWEAQNEFGRHIHSETLRRTHQSLSTRLHHS